MENFTDIKLTRSHIEIFDRPNENFDKYYKQIIGHGEEWDKFYNTLKEKLPVSFRITGVEQLQQPALDIFRNKYLKNISGIIELPWYPKKEAWQINKSKKELKDDIASAELRKFILLETSFGIMSRQESVSMIPPLVLDISSHHTILDMCASPGSKTAQLLEKLMTSSTENFIPEGFVVANDLNMSRCFTLITQLKRISCPCLFVTCQDARCFPSLQRTEIAENGNKVVKYLQFDRVLCDVPCSGDGTIRKNVKIYRKWNLKVAYSLHKMQRNILQRGLELLKVGGYLVYSTCSLNPIENEAVVYTILKQYKGLLKCVDCSDKLKGLSYLPGLRSWNFQESNTNAYQQKIKKCLDVPSEEEYYNLGLNNCIRIHPHLQNTGGFFVALIHKTSELIHHNHSSIVKQTPTLDIINTEPKIFNDRIKHKVSSKEVITFMKNDDEEYNSIKDFFGFHGINCTNLAIRSEKGCKNTIYYINNQMTDFINCNKDRLRIISCGSRLFAKSSFKPIPDSCAFRVVNDCLYLLKNLMSKRIITVVKSDLEKLLKNASVLKQNLTSDFVKQLEDYPQGSIILVPANNSDIPKGICIVGHLGMQRVQLMVTVLDREHYMKILGLTSDIDINFETLKSLSNQNELDQNSITEALSL